MRDVAARLSDAREYARRAAGYVEDVEEIAFASDIMRREAVCFCLLIVGEACVEAAKELVILPSGIPWMEIKGMRNILVHEYWQIDEAIIYKVARDEAVPLADQLDAMIDSLRSV
ncbi:MAG TPA: HepT-like ribonuclease domain-containing protein [Xanthobacteraceae bacterium]|jgi:uncharacterized protein with HEPN domain